MRSAEDVLEALAARPGGPQLLALCEQRDDVALVGGAVRDLLLGRPPRELDVVVAAESASVARQLADALGASVTAHARFGTARVEWEAGRVDIAERRAESYAAPGALPEVRPGSTEEDLARRDFTVNAMAVALAGERRGQLYGVEHAAEDLEAGRLRVLHERSFLDDPTRLYRLARYGARLGFAAESHTAELAAAAVAEGALASVSRARLGAELRLALGASSPEGEADAPAALQAIDELGLLAALHPGLRFDAALARAALALLSVVDAGGRRPPRAALLLLSTLLTSTLARGDADGATESAMYALLNELEFTAADRDLAIYEAMSVAASARRLAGARTPSQIHEAAAHMSPEGVALAGAWGETRDGRERAGGAAGEWLAKLYGVTLLISGEDLLAAGIPKGPEIRRRLDAALLLKLDGELAGEGPDAELSAALEAPV